MLRTSPSSLLFTLHLHDINLTTLVYSYLYPCILLPCKDKLIFINEVRLNQCRETISSVGSSIIRTYQWLALVPGARNSKISFLLKV